MLVSGSLAHTRRDSNYNSHFMWIARLDFTISVIFDTLNGEQHFRYSIRRVRSNSVICRFFVCPLRYIKTLNTYTNSTYHHPLGSLTYLITLTKIPGLDDAFICLSLCRWLLNIFTKSEHFKIELKWVHRWTQSSATSGRQRRISTRFSTVTNIRR